MTRIKTMRLPAGEQGNDPSDYRHDPTYFKRLEAPDLLSWTRDFTLSNNELRDLKAAEWVIPNLVIRGHLVVIAAEPNAGKTTILAHLCGDMVEKGYRVFYVNADISGSDAARFVGKAQTGGWEALLPDLKPGLSTDNIIDQLVKMNEQEERLDDVIFVFDTLKKLTDVISKTRVKGFLKLLRSLTGKGMTIILLGHTNKYKSEEGKPIFEGTGDIRSDADELIYFIPLKNPDGSITVSTDPDKVRGDFEPITFTISKNREVTHEASYTNTAEYRRLRDRFENDHPNILIITNALKDGRATQQAVLTYCKSHGLGARVTRRLLEEYASGQFQQWEVKREERAFHYSLIGTHEGE